MAEHCPWVGGSAKLDPAELEPNSTTCRPELAKLWPTTVKLLQISAKLGLISTINMRTGFDQNSR